MPPTIDPSTVASSSSRLQGGQEGPRLQASHSMASAPQPPDAPEGGDPLAQMMRGLTQRPPWRAGRLPGAGRLRPLASCPADLHSKWRSGGQHTGRIDCHRSAAWMSAHQQQLEGVQSGIYIRRMAHADPLLSLPSHRASESPVIHGRASGPGGTVSRCARGRPHL